jgi:hypothetical protein
VFDDKGIANTEFAAVSVAKDYTTCRAASCWWVGVVARSAAGTAMDEKLTSATHFCRLLRCKIECARALNCAVHDIDTVFKFVGCCRERSCIDNTLLSRVIVSCTLAGVSVCIDGIAA